MFQPWPNKHNKPLSKCTVIYSNWIGSTYNSTEKTEKTLGYLNRKFQLKLEKIWNFRIRNLKSVISENRFHFFDHFWNAVPGGQNFFFSYFSYRTRYTCSFCSIYTKKASFAASNKPLLVRPGRQVFIENLRKNWGIFSMLSLYILQIRNKSKIVLKISWF